MKIGLLDGKLLLANDKLHLVDDETIENCCCTPECVMFCASRLVIKRQCSTPPPDGYPTYPDGAPSPMTHWRDNKCHRLLVYEDIEICNNRIRNASITPDYTIVTNDRALNVNNDGPFYVTDDDPESGLLDSEPLWWEDCLIGGWAEGSVGSVLPTKDDIHNGWDCCKSESFPSGAPAYILNGLYRMYILMQYRRSYLVAAPNTFISKNAEADSAASILRIQLAYLGEIEGCEFVETERATCPVDPPECS